MPALLVKKPSRNLTSLVVAFGLSVVLVTTGRTSPPDAATTESQYHAAHDQPPGTVAVRAPRAGRRVCRDLFLDRYLDSLDSTRSLFLQTDIAQFDAFRATLAQTTRETGDTRVAKVVFARYLVRLEQRTAYFEDTLRNAAFDFTGHDVYTFDREHAQRPRDLSAARQLWLQQLRADYLQEKLDDQHPTDIAATLTHRYAQQLRTMKALGTDEVLDVYLNALAHVYDPHSDYLGREEMESLSIAMNLSLFGIGAALEYKDGYCTVRELVPGGPAEVAGVLKPGDRIVAVGQPGKDTVDITNMPLTQAVELIRGAKGSTVTLKVVPASAGEGAPPKTVSIVRDQVKLENQEAKARIVDMTTGNKLRLGVIDLPSFYAGGDGDAHRSATADVALLLRKLKAEHVQGIVLDLRRNGGGSLAEAISLTGLFIRKGPVVQTRDQAGKIEVGSDTDATVQYDGPLVLLTSRFSASATEILAGALQDYGRAVVVGDSSTFGKGTVQTVVPLANIMDKLKLAHDQDPGALKITISKFYRPSGASTQLRGVTSDIVLPSTSDVSAVSEAALDDPLPWDTIPSATYDHLGRVAPYIARLRADAARRIAVEKDVGDLASDAVRLKQRLATKSVSLNEADRRRELADEARNAEQERADRALAPAPTTYPITLANASSPGLPAATSPEDPSPKSPTKGDQPDQRDRTHGGSADDIILSEAERILADYVDLMKPPVSVGDQRKPDHQAPGT